MARKHLFWAAPLLLLVFIVLAGLLALPAFVAAPAHRATVENFASRLTGRAVHISGKLSLSYLPRPEITATGITITGPDQEIINARSLSLDISITALLHGQFGAQTLRLDAPTISFPWPIPKGINAIAPPPWLAALHARISNGQINLGRLAFSDVNADLFTGAGGRVRLLGTGKLNQKPITLGLSIGQTASIGGTALTAHADYAGLNANLDGSLDANSLLSGQLTMQMPGGGTGEMKILLDATALNAYSIQIQKGEAKLTGNAKLTFKPLGLTANLVGRHIDFSQASEIKAVWPQDIPVQATLDASDLTLDGHHFPSLKAVFTADTAGYALKDLNLDLANTASLKGDVQLARSGALSGDLDLLAPDGIALLTSLDLPPVKDWTTILLQAKLNGTRSAPQLTDIHGTLGRDHVDGHVFFAPQHAAFELNFSRLDLAPLATALRQIAPTTSISLDGELTAAKAEAGPVVLSNLFMDVGLGNGLNIRRATANLYGGMVGGDAVLDPHLKLSAAHGFLNLPSAAPLIAALLPHLAVPHALVNQRLNLTAAAAGTPDALATATVIKLGDLTFTATPLINLAQQSATGAVSLQAPNAIAAFKAAGLSNGCSRMETLPGFPFKDLAPPCIAKANNPGLAFPGPGSLSLRAAFAVAPGVYSLPDFILSSGWINVAGRLALQNHRLTGQINAGTLAFPALPLNAPIPDKLPISGQINVVAGQILYAGHYLFGQTSGTITAAPDSISLKQLKADLGHGALAGDIDLKLPAASMPVLTATLAATNVDASALDLPQPFPLRLTSGQLNANATLTAAGYSVKTWGATLGGHVTLTAQNGSLDGLSLPAIVTALNAKTPAKANYWMSHGDTPFTALSIAMAISQGNCTLTDAKLTGPSGTLGAIGGIDLFDKSLALLLDAHPAVQPPLTLTTRLIGAWDHPNLLTETKAAYSWHPSTD